MNHDMPRVFITPSTHKQLKRVISDAYNAKEKTAAFLDAEVRRAEVRTPLPKHVVTPGSLVRYQLNWGAFSPVRELVYPADFTSERTQISLLSPIGIALLGLRRGDTMPVFIPGTGFQTLHVATVVYPETEIEPGATHQRSLENDTFRNPA